ncbi:hypothetical protein [Actinomadura litoris]|uniref:Uncharacterized protein n=1 Tax=Actinomadura litoris TaxID=2678616 RepID=A0A7K1L941_9ACTN|nr:hypothetical protein [Actinomadura litoris]MUN40833.1 hypothetical protein [Actinomadura litoris]
MAHGRRVLVAGAAALAAAGLAGTGSAMAQDKGREPVRESHVTGDAWLKFPADPEYPYRRFTVDAHGGPWKMVGGKMVLGAARGTVKYDHYSPDVPGGPDKHHYGTIKVDYLMATGPIAIVSGIRQDNVPANERRANFTFYQSPLGHKYDRMGFSWGVTLPQCLQMGSGPAPHSANSSGPFGKWLKGYTVKDAPLELPKGDFQPPDLPQDCSFKE